MSDITLCSNIECPKAKSCYRSQAEPGHWQSWSYFDPPNGECSFYVEIKVNSKKLSKAKKP